jgi:hypothetical protein
MPGQVVNKYGSEANIDSNQNVMKHMSIIFHPPSPKSLNTSLLLAIKLCLSEYEQ